MNDMDTWPEPLRRNAIVCELARVLFETRGRYYGVAFEMADEPPHVRERYVTKAHEILQQLAPLESAGEENRDHWLHLAANLTRAAFATGLHRSDKVIGAIVPVEER